MTDLVSPGVYATEYDIAHFSTTTENTVFMGG